MYYWVQIFNLKTYCTVKGVPVLAKPFMMHAHFEWVKTNLFNWSTWFGEVLLLNIKCPAVCQSWVCPEARHLRSPDSANVKKEETQARVPSRTAENPGVEPGSLYTEGDRPNDRVCLRFGVQASARRKTQYRHPLG
jgi:hypothetical protein